MVATEILVLVLLIALSLQEDVVVFPLHDEQQQLATEINCRVDESRHFRYSSVTNLWGSIEGQIHLGADVTLHCLGDDNGGKYGAEALKYLVEISNLVIEEKHLASDAEELRRKKRGVADFFSNAWKKVKNFFSRMFGGKTNEPEAPRDEIVDEDRLDVGIEESADEDEDPSDYNSLFSTPFEFVQLANGSIPEISFSEEDTDGRVRNFKRHLVDAFATQLSLDPKHKVVMETSVMGEHHSSYNITIGGETAALSSFLYGSEVPQEENGRMVVVMKLVSGEDILSLAPDAENSAINDRDKMGLNTRQTQIFRGGQMLSSSGTSSLVLFLNDEERHRNRRRREENNIMSYFQVQSQFNIQFERRQRRSVDTKNRLDLKQKLKFSSSSRHAEVEDSSAKQKLQDLQKSLGNTTQFVYSLLNNVEQDDDDKLQTVFEMVEQEVRLRLDHGPQSLAADVRKIFNKQVIDNVCSIRFRKCKDLLQLLSLAGGFEAEDVLLFFLTTKTSLNTQEHQQIADILSDLSNPSSKVLSTLTALLQDGSLDSKLVGTVSLSLANMASDARDEQKKAISRVLIDVLTRNRLHFKYRPDALTLDMLEAIGNLGHQSTAQYVFQISSECPGRTDVQVACVHALRRLILLSEVQQWMQGMIVLGPCDVTRALIGSLIDHIHKQEASRDRINWPRFGFNALDRILKEKLLSSSADFECAVEDAVRYFKQKRDPKAKALVSDYFRESSESWDSVSMSRQKRDLWDDLNCHEWKQDSKYRPIQDKEEFAMDRDTYNKRKSCLAFRRLGLKGANAEVYAGMFAGVKEPSDPPKYKLFTKFVSGVNFLGQQMEIGSFYFYHHTGQTKSYVRILGRTRQEFSHGGCTPTELLYRPISHVPLYLLSIGPVQLSLGIHMSSQLSLDTACPGPDAYQLLPLTNVRIGGEAMGTVLFTRGAINLGGNFNYHLQFTFTPTPDMCLRGRHGYDPMSISIEAYYQMWNVGKISWGKHRVWKPSFLSWEVSKGSTQPWFNDTCVLVDSTIHQSMTRNSSTQPSPLNIPPADDNDILVVREI